MQINDVKFLIGSNDRSRFLLISAISLNLLFWATFLRTITNDIQFYLRMFVVMSTTEMRALEMFE